MHYAMRTKNATKYLEHLLKFEVTDLLSEADNCGRTALHICVERGNADGVELLLRRLQNHHPKDREGYSPLHLAAIQGNSQIARIFTLFPEECKDLNQPVSL